MRAYVRVRGPDDHVYTLVHGDLIGRLRRAAVPVDDPRVSEAHALVSLRGGAFRLMALRGRLWVAGQASTDVLIQPGLRVGLAPRLELVIEAVVLPERVLAIQGDGLPRQALVGVESLTVAPVPRLVPGFDPAADAVIWGDADRFWVRSNGETRALGAGDEIHVAGRCFDVVFASLGPAGEPTINRVRPMRIVASFETAEIQFVDRHLDGTGATPPAVLLKGVAARLVTELAAVGGPISWEGLAREVWRDEEDRNVLRTRLDMALLRLRRRLEQGGVDRISSSVPAPGRFSSCSTTVIRSWIRREWIRCEWTRQ